MGDEKTLPAAVRLAVAVYYTALERGYDFMYEFLGRRLELVKVKEMKEACSGALADVVAGGEKGVVGAKRLLCLALGYGVEGLEELRGSAQSWADEVKVALVYVSLALLAPLVYASAYTLSRGDLLLLLFPLFFFISSLVLLLMIRFMAYDYTVNFFIGVVERATKERLGEVQLLKSFSGYYRRGLTGVLRQRMTGFIVLGLVLGPLLLVAFMQGTSHYAGSMWLVGAVTALSVSATACLMGWYAYQRLVMRLRLQKQAMQSSSAVR